MKQRVLLTGGAGYIGSHTYAALVEAGYDVLIVDNFCNASREVPTRLSAVTGNDVQVIQADVLDRAALDRVFADNAIDAVVHFAAYKSVGESVRNPLAYMQNNVGGLVTLMQAMESAGVRRLVFSSSATVYGEAAELPTPETAALGYGNPYGHSKLICEQIIEQTAAADPRWAVGVLRYFNPVGAHPSGLIGEDPAGVPDNLMPYVAKVAAGELPVLSVFGGDYPTPDGTGVRDYIHVSDLAQGHVLSLQALERDGTGHVVNLGTGRGYSVLEVIAAYARASNQHIPYKIAPRRPGDAASSYADPSLAKTLLGFEAKYDLHDMCRTSWMWMQNATQAMD
ncbi:MULTISPECIES: UDP-glucose 4-epimerase GalE [Marivita]|uniref:UDP-glucose 4-epimerase n=1 Tax=Marivita cryptomonadis TaxID=505252 RepID=A0A9Q2NY64_9RHOB|nr:MULTISPECIES: UDP-glucose 4-epimerase GalE [Marivita]MCR9170140.1 UDP-glucose 4-epimerase GalE [Paracoccaceae bacterium]MBM2321776.1 UDP-glucose 4-epimerase GalE [Marivita cryptomonadis]MBM2331597.1 UDP-glucose 4-epimerase GalE [Marivita cryptomonadis]MBM2341183.1 UDP-glucose 4-epimerase GalE [Marivita cryptomonadis]MBM2345845.1 UDP-glucose 4-epimerase GalE [Marivita cryptomonadis]